MSGFEQVWKYARQTSIGPTLADDPEVLGAVTRWQERRLLEDATADGLLVLGEVASEVRRPAPWAPWDEMPRRWWERLLRRPARLVPPPAILVSVTRVARLPVSPGQGQADTGNDPGAGQKP